MADKPGQTATLVLRQIEDSVEVTRSLKGQIEAIIQIATQITQAFLRGNRVFLFGNGGSAADAEHIAAELAGRFRVERQSLPAMALSASTVTITAIANDFGYQEIFARQLRGIVTKGDVVVGISTSGASPNVIAGIEEAKARGAITAALTGKEGKLRQLAQYVISIPSADTPRIQEAHITAGHIICCLVEENLFGTNHASLASDSM